MPRYTYIAKTREGLSKKGVLDVGNESDLAKTLRAEGSILIKAELENKKSKLKLSLSLPFFNSVSLVEKTMFTRNLRVMVSSGIPLPRALGILAKQSKSKKFKRVILKIKQNVLTGSSFSDSLINYRSIFPEVFTNMIKVGEENGTLEKVLDVLTDQMEKEHEIRSKIKGALIYPAIIFISMFVIGIIMLIVVVPKLSKLFNELQIKLPITTRVVIAIGNFLAVFWYLVPIILILIIVAFRLSLKTKMGKRMFDGFVLKIPIISPIIKKTYSAITVRTLSSLISTGVPIVRSLEIVSGTLNNVYYKDAIKDVAEKVSRGSKLAEVLQDYDEIYPNLVIQMIAVGEETGETSSILAKLADFFEEEVDNATKNLSAVIEPFLMLIIGVAVGFFAISMIQPMYSMMSSL